MADEAEIFANRLVWVHSRAGKQGTIFQSRVLSADDQTLVIAQPYRQGRIVVYNAGQTVILRMQDPEAQEGPGPEYPVQVLERRLRPLPSLVLTLTPDLVRALRGQSGRYAKVVAITSGKGGVGKTTLTVNLGIALAQAGVKTSIIDADLGLANVDVMMKIDAPYNLNHLINGERALREIVLEGPHGLRVVPGGSGLSELANLNEWQFGRLVASLTELEREADLILIDTGAGLSRNVTNFFLAADDVVVVTNPEPPATLDAYGVLKVVGEQGRRHGVKLVVNRAQNPNEASLVAEKLAETAKRFLGIEVTYLGPVLEDQMVVSAVKRQKPLLLHYNTSVAGQGIKRLARQLQPSPEAELQPGGERLGFFQRLRQLFANS